MSETMGAPPLPEAAIAAGADEVKAFLRIAGEGDDAALRRAVAGALALGEGFIGVALIERAHRAVLPATGGWQRLAGAPVRTIGPVEGLPADGAAFALPVASYAIDIDVRGDGWVRVIQPGAAGRVRVSYQAGQAADWAALPAAVRDGAVRLAAHLIERGGSDAMPPASISALWRPFRRMRLMHAGRPA